MLELLDTGTGVLVASGTRVNVVDDAVVATPQFWSSADGKTWTASPSVIPPLGDVTIPFELCRLPAGGALALGGYSSGRRDVFFLMRSLDGSNWEVGASFNDPTTAGSASNCATRAGDVVVTGASGSPLGAAIWSTVDGTALTPIPLPAELASSRLFDVHVTADGRTFLLAWTPAVEGVTPGGNGIVELVGDELRPVSTFDDDGADAPFYRSDPLMLVSSGSELLVLGTSGASIGVWRSPIRPN